MEDKLWTGVDEIPGIGQVTWSIRLVDNGGALIKVFDRAQLAGGELSSGQLASVRSYLEIA